MLRDYEEMKSRLSFTPVVKDQRAFEMEKKFHTPFYENIMTEGVLIFKQDDCTRKFAFTQGGGHCIP